MSAAAIVSMASHESIQSLAAARDESSKKKKHHRHTITTDINQVGFLKKLAAQVPLSQEEIAAVAAGKDGRTHPPIYKKTSLQSMNDGLTSMADAITKQAAAFAIKNGNTTLREKHIYAAVHYLYPGLMRVPSGSDDKTLSEAAAYAHEVVGVAFREEVLPTSSGVST